MKQEFTDQLLDLTRRAREFGKSEFEVDVELTDDYFTVTKINLNDETVTIDKGDGSCLEEFPLSSLSDAIIDEVLYHVACSIAQEEEEIEKVFDRNTWANV